MTFTHDQLASSATLDAFTAGFNVSKGSTRCPYSRVGDKRHLAQAFICGRNHSRTRQGRELGVGHAWKIFLQLEGFYADGCHGTDVAKVAAGVTRMADLPAT